MASGKVLTIDFSEDRLRKKAEGYFEDGEYISALEYARKYLALYGKEKDMYALIADIYENMGLHSSAVNSWFQYLDCCEAEDLPEVYEGLAVNFLNLGNEAQSAFYYNRLIDEDDTLTVEDKREIAETFRPDSKSPLKFVHPPELTDYSEQLYSGGEALKSGRIEEAIKTLSKVEKGSKEYRSARETLAIAYLLNGNAEQAEKTCLEVIEEYGDSVQALSTLSAIYSEQGKKGESREIAYRLYQTSGNNKEEIYKIATVCCENDMHEEAFQLFSKLEKDLPYDGNFLYFKSVAAYQSGRMETAVSTLERLCSIYPDAAVASYYLKEIKRHLDDPTKTEKPLLTYFYRLPQKERELRCRALIAVGNADKEESFIFAERLRKDGYFSWCFDEMDGMEQDLQYLGVVTAEYARQDGFLREVLLDCEVKDALKVEMIRLLYLRNEYQALGIVVCNIYKELELLPVEIGEIKRKEFLEGYAKTASRFCLINETYAKKLCRQTQKLYDKIEELEAWELCQNENDIACALYFLADMRDLGKNVEKVALTFEANGENVLKLIEICKTKTKE